MKKTVLSLTFLFVIKLAFAVEGMWLPLLLSMLNEKEMQSMGMKMTAEDIYSVNKGSLKDAIVSIGGCTAEMISPMGLMLTNHHCGLGQIQAHTTLENDYLGKGFWAKSLREELPARGMIATFISRIEDVTKQALNGVTEGMDPRQRQSTIDKNLNDIRANCKKESWEDVMIRPFFHGNQYFLFVTVTYRDVRLVGAPPVSIGKFGADTDNWVWPRHTGDFSIFRVYAGKDNLPAEYSADNVPFKPKHFLPISLDGIKDGDFTLVFGFPGRTNQYLPAVAVKQIVDVLDPTRIAIRDKTLAIWDGAMRSDAAIRIQYTSKQAGLANSWKKWQGEVLGLTRTKAVQKKQSFEKDFQKAVNANKTLSARYGNILSEFERLYAEIESFALAKEYYDEITQRNVELLRIAGQVNRLVKTYESEGAPGFEAAKKRTQGMLQDFYKNYNPGLDQKVFAELMEMLMKKVDTQFLPAQLIAMTTNADVDYQELAAQVFMKSMLTGPDKLNQAFQKTPDELMLAIKSDPACFIAQQLSETYNATIIGKYNELDAQINALQQTYMKALMETFPNRRFYPDANSTMRVSYGKVGGFQPRDAVSYTSQTYLDGIMEKYIPGDYEFDIPEKLRQLHAAKDYGVYGENGKMPVAFIASNHTTGGNSGSPAIDAHGNLIGLNFDRVWEGTMSDYNFDESLCRNIMVDIRYVLFIVDKLAGASNLIQEMKLVHPKKLPAKAAPRKAEGQHTPIDGKQLKTIKQ
jgi:hypothetical protein